MQILKVLNNNVAIVAYNGQEAVAMGKGICFQKKRNDEIEESKINKLFVLENNDFSNRLVQLVTEIPTAYFKISHEIIECAEKDLNCSLNENIYITLTDHIHFAIENYKKDIKMKNSMLWDIKRLYKKEFAIALKAIDIIEKETGIRLLDDEAASISMHLINARINKDMPEIINMMNIVQEIQNIVKYSLHIDFDEDSLSYYRFITHLKFLAERIFSDSYYSDEDFELIEIIQRKYLKSFSCSKKVEQFIYDKYGKRISIEELVYLTIHIERIRQKKE